MRKACGCGAVYDGKGWGELDYVGTQQVPEGDDGPAEAYEFRNCPCGSTLAVDITPPAVATELFNAGFRARDPDVLDVAADACEEGGDLPLADVWRSLAKAIRTIDGAKIGVTDQVLANYLGGEVLS